jgi:hypothetical protein
MLEVSCQKKSKKERGGYAQDALPSLQQTY